MLATTMLDIEKLLVPISVTQVSGEDLSFSSDLDHIADARREDDPALEQGEWKMALKAADWPFVATHCEQLIRSRSKDLRLAVWLAEAHAKTRHFRGLGDGYTLLAGLCERFWDSLYPAPEEGDHELRIGNLFWLLSRSAQLVKEIPVIEDGAVALADFDAARLRAAHVVPATDHNPWGKPALPEGPDIDELDARRRQNSAAFNRALLEDANYCLASLQVLERAVDSRLGADGPGFGAAREALQHAIDFIGLLAPDAGADMAGMPAASAVDSMAGSVATAAQRHDGAIASRQQALEQLRRVAEYFRRAEPHSPVAYLADKAAAWGAMPLHEWLRSVVRDRAQMALLDEVLGTAPAPSEG